MKPWPAIPKDAIEYFRSAFADANRIATERILNVPNIRETSLDDALVDALIPFSPPKRLRSGAVVEMDIHNIGGLRRIYRWETADIAVLVFIYRGRRMVAQKIGLLRTKRLFPKNNDVLDDDPEGFRYGMNAFLNRDAQSPLAVLNRQFVFAKLGCISIARTDLFIRPREVKRSGGGGPCEAWWRGRVREGKAPLPPRQGAVPPPRYCGAGGSTP
jgi:hypothetical protein